MFEINGIELEYDAFDAETSGLMEKAKEEVLDTISGSTEIMKSKGVQAALQIQCGAVKRFFDTMFGEGTGIKVCGEKDNLYICAEAFGLFLQEDDRQSNGFKDNPAISFMLEKSKRINGNRQHRRAK